MVTHVLIWSIFVVLTALSIFVVGCIIGLKKQIDGLNSKIDENQKELIKRMSEETSAVVEEIEAAKNELVETIVAERTEVTTKLGELEAQNEALSEQIDALENDDDADLDKLKEIRDGIRDSIAGVKGIFDNSPVQPSTPADGGDTAPLGENGGAVDGGGDGTGTEQP